MATPFYGRKHELKLLAELLKKKFPSLVVVQGRRRVGKSRLVEEFAKKYTFYHFTGSPPTEETTKQSQIKEFAIQLSEQIGMPEIVPDDWSKLFYLLAKHINTGRVIVLFDEISWMGSKDPEFLGKLKNAWDVHFKKNPKLIFVLCGSVSAWIDKNILSSTGFVGRISLRITLKELPLKDCNQFWLQNSHNVSPFEKLKVLSVTGGIPRYLEEIKPALSAEQNIRNLCFQSSGILVNEFHEIFSDVFSYRTPRYKQIVKALSLGPLEIRDISKNLKISQSGAISEYLDDLVKSGFISRDYTWHLSSGRPSRLSHFRLSDNYIRFYLKYIEKELDKIKNDEYAVKTITSLPQWDTIMGLQFENLVLRNRQYIKDKLSLAPHSIVSNNPFFQRATQKAPGCQIDYLIQTSFRDLYVCEMKFSSQPIGKNIIKEVQQKIDRLIYPRGFSVKPILIHVNGVKDSVVDSGFFVKIIDFGKILE